MTSTAAEPRMTRSRSRGLTEKESQDPESQTPKLQGIEKPISTAPQSFVIGPQIIDRGPQLKPLPDLLTRKLLGVDAHELQLIGLKQQKLRQLDVDNESSHAHRKSALLATAIFAQAAAGTAVCIDPSGLLLTCSHCVAETRDELDYLKQISLLTAPGQVILARCIAWDARRDLALLRVVATQGNTQGTAFHCLPIATSMPKAKSPIFCVGHPGSEDLETLKPGVETNYPVISVSRGRFMGYSKGQDIQDNSEIGALMHNAWTYWGHSGAPLVHSKTGQLVGLHSSWDDQTAMRRGVGLEAIHAFLGSI